MEGRQETGLEGELKACSFLSSLGYKILEQRYRVRLGEVDIIALDGKEYVFVEVKRKTGSGFGLPEEMVGVRKVVKIKKVGESYLLERGLNPERVLWRIDMVAVEGGVVRHHQNISKDMGTVFGV